MSLSAELMADLSIQFLATIPEHLRAESLREFLDWHERQHRDRGVPTPEWIRVARTRYRVNAVLPSAVSPRIDQNAAT